MPIAHEVARCHPGSTLPRTPSDDPFFIVGAPRSGTTLLRTMLSAHPRICIPHETEFFMLVPPASPTGTGPALRRSLAAYTDSLPFRQQELDASRYLSGVADVPSRADAFLTMMRLHAARSGKPRIGEKSPHHYRHVQAIAAELPGAKFIHILRDVRDVAASGMQLFWSTRSAIAQARSWRGAVREHHRLLGRMPPDRYTEVRFESLIADPERELRRLCDFLGEQFHPGMLRFDERARAAQRSGDASWSGASALAVDSAAIGRHKSRLHPRQLDAIQRIAALEMRQLGYEPIPVRRSASWMVLNVAERIAHVLARYRRSIRKRLPRVAPGVTRTPGRAARASA